ncbi:MAG: hypothetical protein ACI8O8_002719 [Oleiphilaceae bacterium]|jgi:hypothetical protein
MKVGSSKKSTAYIHRNRLVFVTVINQLSIGRYYPKPLVLPDRCIEAYGQYNIIFSYRIDQ